MVMDLTWTKIINMLLPGHGNFFWYKNLEDKEYLNRASLFSFQVRPVGGIVPYQGSGPDTTKLLYPKIKKIRKKRKIIVNIHNKTHIQGD